MSIKTITSNVYTVDANKDTIVNCNCSINSITVNLIDKAHEGKNITIKKVDYTPNTVTVVNGSESHVLRSGNDYITFLSDGNTFYKTDENNSSDSRINVVDYGFDPLGMESCVDKMNVLLSAIGSNPADVYMPVGTYLFDDDVTIPSNINLIFSNGAKFVGLVGTEDLVCNCSIDAGLWQIFDNIVVSGSPLNTEIYPEWFGAVVGVTDEASAIQQAFDLYTDGQVISFSNRTYNFTVVNITSSKIKVKGSRNAILTGKFLVGDSPLMSRFNISDVTFKADTLVEGSSAIELSYIEKFVINNVRFENYDKAIYCGEYSSFQHVKRGIIKGCFFYNVNYCLYGVRPLAYANYMVGDVQFQGNQYCEANISHIHMVGLDGAIITDNTFFFSSYAGQSAIKTNNINIDYCNWVVINNNNCFEAGSESIKISRFQNLTINGNNIAWAGQNILSDGILVTGGDQAGDFYSNAVISNNNINKPTKSGIGIGAACGYINVNGNTIIAAGNADYYYGATAIGSVNHYGIYNESGSKKLTIVNNTSPLNDNNLLGEEIFYDGNYESSTKSKRKHYTLTYSTSTTTTFSVAGYDIVVLNVSSYDTMTNLTGGYEGKEISLYGYNGRTTFQHNTNIVLVGEVDTLIPAGGTLFLRYVYGKWREVSRTY